MTGSLVRAVSVAPFALAQIQCELAATADDGNETGGILLGAVDDGVAHVRHAGDPGPNAIRTPAFFLRDRKHAQALADSAFAVDASVWIGEWHTHPYSPAVPSKRDLATYATLVADPELDFEEVISLIVGEHDGAVMLRAWTCSAAAAYEVPLTIAQLTTTEDPQ
jgi:integrative and conjugative element protein (TIGR02256 family)